MKKYRSWMLVLCLLTGVQAAHAQEAAPPVEPDSGGVVCAPGVYLGGSEDCVVLGPAAYLTELARAGVSLTPRPLPARKPDASLAQLPFSYFHVISDGPPVPIYSTPCETGSGGQQLLPGFVYVSYSSRATDCGVYYLTKSGGWIPGKGARVSEIPSFQGLELRSTPRNSFGWAFEQIPVKTAPGYSTAAAGQQILPFQVVQVYEAKEAEGAEWYRIGPERWLEGRKVARVTPNTTPPEGVTTGRWIEVDLAEQTLAVYDGSQLVYATVIASGQEPFFTRPGLFQIFEKKEAETMRNNDPSDFYYIEDVPWTMYFDGARALHGAFWRTRFGYPQSHGCVNLSVGDAHWIFNWAQQGDWVYVHDPTGQTPTDPALYSGGAY